MYATRTRALLLPVAHNPRGGRDCDGGPYGMILELRPPIEAHGAQH